MLRKTWEGAILMKIVIIEDDEFSLLMLEEIFDKYFSQVEIMGCFSEAETALDFLADTTVDLIITDIKLPGMDGIEFAKICTVRYPFTPIILLSAYNNFEYARKAINTSVVNYILKPVTYDNLYNAINSVQTALDTSNHTNFMDFATMEHCSELLRSYLSGDIMELDKNKFDLTFGGYANMKYMSVISISIFEYDNYIKSLWHHGEDKLLRTINNVILSSDLELIGLVVDHKNEIFDIVCMFENEANVGYIKKISDILFHVLKMQCTITELVSISPISNIQSNAIKYKVNKMLDDFLNGATQGSITTEELSFEELKYMLDVLSKKFIKYVDKEDASKFLLETVDNKKPSSYEEMCRYVNDMIGAINAHRWNKYDDVVLRAIKYIEVNCTKKITLSSVSKYVSLSPKYFSRLFKQRTNKNVSDYIEEKRIERAKEMMMSDENIKLQALADILGYDAYSTFYKNFKKLTGMTPAQYISKNKKQ